eukprot:164957_1
MSLQLTTVLVALLNVTLVLAQDIYFVWFLYPEYNPQNPYSTDPWNNQREHIRESYSNAKIRRNNDKNAWISPAADNNFDWNHPKERNALCEWLEIPSGAPVGNCRWQCHSHYKPNIAATIEIQLLPRHCRQMKRKYADHTKYYPLSPVVNYEVYISGNLQQPLSRRPTDPPLLLMRPIIDITHSILLVTPHTTSLNRKSFHAEMYLNLDRLWDGPERQRTKELDNFNHEYVFTLIETAQVNIQDGAITSSPADGFLDTRQSIIIFRNTPSIKKKYYKRSYFHIHSRNVRYHFREDYAEDHLLRIFDNVLPQINHINDYITRSLQMTHPHVETKTIATAFDNEPLKLGLSRTIVKWDRPRSDERAVIIARMKDKLDQAESKLTTAKIKARRTGKVAPDPLIENIVQYQELQFKKKKDEFEEFIQSTSLETYEATNIGDLERPHGDVSKAKLHIFGSLHGSAEIGGRVFDTMTEIHRNKPIDYVLIESDQIRIHDEIDRYSRQMYHYINHATAATPLHAAQHFVETIMPKEMLGDMLATYLWALMNGVPIYLVDLVYENYHPFLLFDRANMFSDIRSILNWGCLTYSPIYFGIMLQVRSHFMTTAINGILKHHYANNHGAAKYPNIWITVGNLHLKVSEHHRMREIGLSGFVLQLPYAMRELLQGKVDVLPAFIRDVSNFGINWDIYKIRTGAHAWDRHLSAKTSPSNFIYNGYESYDHKDKYESRSNDFIDDILSQETHLNRYIIFVFILISFCICMVFYVLLFLVGGLGTYTLTKFYNN